jgi:uncharacterized protein YecT (DUF1311 family)
LIINLLTREAQILIPCEQIPCCLQRTKQVEKNKNSFLKIEEFSQLATKSFNISLSEIIKSLVNLTRWTCIIVCTLLINKAINAQDIGQTNILDQKLRQCLEDSSTSQGMINCEIEAYLAWDAELSRYYKLLIQNLSDDDKNSLLNSQRKWIEFQEDELRFAADFYRRDAMYLALYYARKTDLVRNRALVLKAYYELIIRGK